jgi:hypothetical protein
MPVPPNRNWGVQVNGCSAVSYFSTRMGSIIGAGRLSFRVRDGSGRFPAAVAAVTLFFFQPRPLLVFLVVGCGLLIRVWLRGFVVLHALYPIGWCYPVWVCVSFRPVSASSLRPLRGF